MRLPLTDRGGATIVKTQPCSNDATPRYRRRAVMLMAITSALRWLAARYTVAAGLP